MKTPAAFLPSLLLPMLFSLVLAGCAAVPHTDNAGLVRQVTAAEQAFAASMAQRDFAAFERFLADDALFHSGPTPLRGKAAVAEFWQRFFNGAQAPFSWAPDQVDVIDSGTLAYSSGPVRDPQGKQIARFNSVWRQEGPGQWKIVFDKGEAVCDCTGPAGR